MLVSWNLFLQSFSSPMLDKIFLLFSYLGNELIFMAVVAAIYLCIDKEKGLHLAISLFSSFTLNSGIKDFLKIPRPFEYNDLLRRIDLTMSPGYSFPSAHAQMSSSMAVGITRYYRKIGVFCCILALLIGISRIYLGVHTPVDICAGFVLGILWTLFSIYLSQRLIKRRKYLLLLYLFPCYLFYFWHHDENLLKLTAVFTSFLIGYLIEDTYLHYSASLKLHAGLKMVLLLVGCAAIKIPLKLLLPDIPLCIYFSYFLLGLWISLFCPWLLLILKQKKSRNDNAVLK